MRPSCFSPGAIVLAGGVCLASSAWPGPAEAKQAVLYSVGPGEPTFERFGHTVLCIRDREGQSDEKGADSEVCYDFGMWADHETDRVVSESLRGRPAFVAVRMRRSEAIERYRVLDRSVVQQVLPLEEARVEALARVLDERARSGSAYAYHPLRKNCSTEVRDLLDEITDGELRAASERPDGPSYRTLAREGLSGLALELGLLSVFVQREVDEPTSRWQRGFLPSELSLLVEESLGAKPELVFPRRVPPLPRSPLAGELALGLVGFLIAALTFGLRKRPFSLRLVRGATGYLVLSLGIASAGLTFFSPYPEFGVSLATLVLLPTDCLVAHLGNERLSRYLRLRLALIAALVGASVLGFVGVPLLGLGAFVGLPLLAMLVTLGASGGATDQTGNPASMKSAFERSSSTSRAE